jgi:hypothetical protein
MKKKQYEKPSAMVVVLKQQQALLTGSPYSMQATGHREQLVDDTESLGW